MLQNWYYILKLITKNYQINKTIKPKKNHWVVLKKPGFSLRFFDTSSNICKWFLRGIAQSDFKRLINDKSNFLTVYDMAGFVLVPK